MRGWVCNLLLQFAVTLGSKSRRIHGHILLSHLKLPQPGGPGPRIYIPQEQAGPVILPGTGHPSRRLSQEPGAPGVTDETVMYNNGSCATLTSK
jgi:hypothetical protein